MPLSQSEIQELREDFWTSLATSGAVLWWNIVRRSLQLVLILRGD
jgi:hypothetical protein